MEVLFYGLFKDTTILKKNGIEPSNLRVGFLNDYALKIGNRTSLIPSKNERSYGIAMTVDDAAIKGLYAEPSVAENIPEVVSIITATDETIEAKCYNLPIEALTGTNPSYVEALYEVAHQVGPPKGYQEMIKGLSDRT